MQDLIVLQVPAKPLPFIPVPGAPRPVLPPQLPPVTVNNPKFVSVPAVPARHEEPALPLPDFTRFVRLGKSADIGEEEEERLQDITTVKTQLNETESS